MNSLKYLRSYISAFGLSLLAGLMVFLCWQFAALPTVPPVVPFLTNGDPPPIVPTPQLAATTIVLFSLVVGLTVKGAGVRSCWLFLLGIFLFLILVSAVVAQFFGIDLLVIPLVVAGVVSLVLVQVNALWQLDRQLSKTLFSSPRGSELVQRDEAKTRLASGLKLLSAVLPIGEAVVFQSGTPDDFQTVARWKGSTGPLTDPGRNSVWRDGIRLCERAVSSGELVLQTVEGNSSSVAVPLRHEHETVGVLLLRLNIAFCDDDRPLLEAVGAQFARNLTRDSFSKNSFHNSRL